MFGTAYSPQADALIYPEVPTLVSFTYIPTDYRPGVAKTFTDLNKNVIQQQRQVAPESGKGKYIGKVCIPVRYIFAVVSSLGFFLMYSMRINLSVAMVAMVNNTALSEKENASTLSDECGYSHFTNGSTNSKEGEFVWNEKTQGLILGSFYWGYIITQLPGGILGERFTAKWLFGLGVIWTGIFTLLTPIAAVKGDYGAVIAIRALQGFGQGVTFPTMNYLISRWAPPSERSGISTIIYAGTLLGTMVGVILSGVLIDNDVGGGWPIVFYLFGALGVGWFLLWAFFAFESPETHPWISDKEKYYILKSLNRLQPVKKKAPKFPFKSVITSLPMWAIVVAHICNNWGLYLFLSDLPLYLKTILQYDMKENSLRSALPFLTCWLCSLICSNLSDFLIKNKYIRATVARRMFNSLGQIVPGFLILGVTFIKCKRDIAYVLLVVALTLNGATYAGFNCNHVDLSPVLAGTLFGITNTLATIPGFIGPSIVGIFTEGNATQAQWDKIFYITVAIYWFSGIFYGFFGQGVEQPWNKQCLEDLNTNQTSEPPHQNGNGIIIENGNSQPKESHQENYFNISDENLHM